MLVSECELKSLAGRNEIKGKVLYLTPLDVLDFHDGLLIFFACHWNVVLRLLSNWNIIWLSKRASVNGSSMFSGSRQLCGLPVRHFWRLKYLNKLLDAYS